MVRMFNANMALKEMLTALISQRRAGERAGDVLSQMLDAVDDEGNGLSDEQLLGHLMILLVAGHETTTTLTAWALYMLAKRPELRERMEAELAECPGNCQSRLARTGERLTRRRYLFCGG